MDALTCFKAYDIRGRLGAELNEDIAYFIGHAFAKVLAAKRVVLGRDIRPTSEGLQAALARALREAGVDVLDLGLAGTEEMYFATGHLGADGGIMVTASHNPIDYNGMKMVRADAAPVGADTGLGEMKSLAEAKFTRKADTPGRLVDAAAARSAYVERVLSFVNPRRIGPVRIVANSGNGASGPTFDAVLEGLVGAGAEIDVVRLHHTPDGTFPNGIPNPLLDENQPVTSQAVVDAGADIGIAWDGDFDRCFFFDATGRFIAGEYLVGLLAECFLSKEPAARIVHDPRVVWNTQDVVAAAGGVAVQSRTGHAFLKQALRDTGAVYGGEMSAHHYFREFYNCDSGMVPWVLLLELMGQTGRSLAELVGARMEAFPSSGEINFRIADPKAAIDDIVGQFAASAVSRDDTDGVSLAFEDWRFNLRMSNTEPLVRLNVETRGNQGGLREHVRELTAALSKRAG